MFTHVGALAAEGPITADLTGRRSAAEGRRTHQPIRRNSRLKGKDDRSTWWTPTNRQEVRQIVQAARRYELAGRISGRRNGPLGHVAIEILELFANLVSFRTGQLDPSLDYLMVKLRRSRDAIVRALKALRAHGFLDWLRRYVPTGNATGPQVQQTSNAYKMALPAMARRLLGWMGRPAPLPEDFEHQKAQRVQMIEAHEATLSAPDLALHRIEDDELAVVVARLLKAASARNDRESGKRSESRS